jgi:hypothetical protein
MATGQTKSHGPVHLGQETIWPAQTGRLVQVRAVKRPDAVQRVTSRAGGVPTHDAAPVRAAQVQHGAQ